MNLLVVVSEDVHVQALRHARNLGVRAADLPPDLMNAMLNDQITRWVERLWDNAEGALRRAFNDGWTAARLHLHRFSENLEELTADLAEHAEEVRAMIAARLNDYLQETIEGALGRVRPVIVIGGATLNMTKITIQQQIRLSGSLSASLAKICEFAANGEISVVAEYGGSPAAP